VKCHICFPQLLLRLRPRLLFSAKEESPGATSFASSNILDIIKNLKRSADVVAISLHWGKPWTQEINVSQIIIADKILDARADIVIGHHPHMLQAVKLQKNALTLFSLGNFIIRPDYEKPPNAHNSVIALINITKGEIQSCGFYPVIIDAYGIPRVAEEKDADNIISNLANLSKLFNTTIKINGQIGVVNTS
jgi:poly-gamma-glutamate capsule biosynthesis protein CapA/YwtB (metallophosphatase superfamily)